MRALEEAGSSPATTSRSAASSSSWTPCAATPWPVRRQARVEHRRQGLGRAARCRHRADLRAGRGAATRAGDGRRRRDLRRHRPRDPPAGAAGRARARSRSCRPRAPSARAGSIARTTSCCASAASSRPGAADVLRHERAHALPQRAPDAAQAARVADRAGHQRERHDDDRRDLLRRQRLPGRAGRGAGRRDAAGAADRRRRAATPPTRASTRPRGWSARSPTSSELEACRSATAASPLGSGGMRSKVAAAEMATAAGIPTVIGSGFEPGLLGRAWAGEPVGHALLAAPVRQPRFKLWLRYAKPSLGGRGDRRGRGAGAARGRDVAAAGRDRRAWRGPSRRATRSTCASRGTPSARGSPTTPRQSCGG